MDKKQMDGWMESKKIDEAIDGWMDRKKIEGWVD